MNEADHLPQTMDCIARQKNARVKVWLCVNQPESWWADQPEVCENNRLTVHYLKSWKEFPLQIIDRTSPGMGWTTGKQGVGYARKTIMDAIAEEAEPNDIIVSLDADTTFDADYLASVAKVFDRYPQAVALSNPYYHPLTDNERLNRHMLRYEIYMRHYALNMWRIGSPYCFTALGSAMAFPLWAYRKVGGMTPKKSGEDFYFLQKLRKSGWICNHNHKMVYPAARYSDRVFFGTGPALIRGSKGDWSSYPIYSYKLFDQIREAYGAWPQMFKDMKETPISPFLRQVFKEDDPLQPLRENASDVSQFVRACHQKVDGLRILQFLKAQTTTTPGEDALRLLNFLTLHYPAIPDNLSLEFPNWLQGFSFETTPLPILDALRCELMEAEILFQKADLP